MYNNQKQSIVKALDSVKVDGIKEGAESRAPLSRRHFLQVSGISLAGVLLAACAAPAVQPGGGRKQRSSGGTHYLAGAQCQLGRIIQRPHGEYR